jgi:catechol 2,3-dioxygenase-like lactoylglutathione lyase family enzyme
MVSFKHVALLVPDLEEAEEHYRTIFGAELVGREALATDGNWYTAPHELGWDDLNAAGVHIQWVGLRRDDLLIALLPGRPDAQRTLYCIGLNLTTEEAAAIRERLPDTTTLELHEDDQLTFVDRYGFRWQGFDGGFTTAGDGRGDWLEVQSGHTPPGRKS